MSRLFLRSGAYAVASVLAFGAPAHASSLTISNWDGYMAPDAIEKFNTDSGNEAELVLHATNEEIMGKLIASKGVGYDVVFVSSPFAEVLNNLGLAETLDHDRIPNIANLSISLNTMQVSKDKIGVEQRPSRLNSFDFPFAVSRF